MRLLLALIVMLAACYSEPEEQTDAGLFCELEAQAKISAPVWADLLIVVDDIAAMAPYQDRIARELAELGAILDTAGRGVMSYRIAVVRSAPSTGGALVPSSADCGFTSTSVLRYDPQPWWQCGNTSTRTSTCEASNFSGRLGAALACIGQVGAVRQGRSAFLENAMRAMDGTHPDHPGFPRPDSFRAVLFIAGSDDASSGELDDYKRFFYELSHWGTVAVVGSAQTSPRLAALVLEVGVDEIYDLDSGDWTNLVAPYFPYGQVPEEPCIDASGMHDLDEGQPGLQPECAVTLYDHLDPTGAVAIPACDMVSDRRPDAATALPCWWLDHGPLYKPSCTDVVRVNGYLSPRLGAEVRCAQVCE